MLPKVPKSNFWKLLKSGAKIIFIAEAVGFAVSYGIYHHMNTSQEFRGYMNAQFPFVLDYYYKLGGLGYVLLLFTEPSREKLEKIKESVSKAHLREDEQKNLLFAKRLKGSTIEVPIYTKKKEN